MSLPCRRWGNIVGSISAPLKGSCRLSSSLSDLRVLGAFVSTQVQWERLDQRPAIQRILVGPWYGACEPVSALSSLRARACLFVKLCHGMLGLGRGLWEKWLTQGRKTLASLLLSVDVVRSGQKKREMKEEKKKTPQPVLETATDYPKWDSCVFWGFWQIQASNKGVLTASIGSKHMDTWFSFSTPGYITP